MAASVPAFASDDVMTPVNRSPGKAVTDRIEVDPMLPVPHTATPIFVRTRTP